MNFRRSMPIVLLLAWLAVDAVVYWAAESVDRLVFGGILNAILYCQIVVLVGWLLIGREGWKTTAVGAIFLGTIRFSPSVTIGEIILLVVMVLPLLIGRLAGWRFKFVESPSDSHARLFQVTLREILIFMTVVALLAAAWKALGSDGRGNGTEDWPAFALQALVDLLYVALFTTWMAILWLRPPYAVATMIVAQLAGCLVLTWAFEAPDVRLLGLSALWLGVGPAVLIAHMTALQWAGFRWVRVEHQATSP
jgi:hypothetical protein